MVSANLQPRLQTLEAKIPAPHLAMLRKRIETAPDEDLFRMNPLRFAAENSIAPRAAIDLFLYATHEGILEFEWGLICGICGAFVVMPHAMKAVATRRDCKL